jgi:hypothetical protein
MNEVIRKPSNHTTPYDADVDLDALREFVNQSGTPAMPGEWVKSCKGDYLFGQDERKASVIDGPWDDSVPPANPEDFGL